MLRTLYLVSSVVVDSDKTGCELHTDRGRAIVIVETFMVVSRVC